MDNIAPEGDEEELQLSSLEERRYSWVKFVLTTINWIGLTDFPLSRRSAQRTAAFKVRWPSGLRRQTKDHVEFRRLHLVRKGMGSNPILII